MIRIFQNNIDTPEGPDHHPEAVVAVNPSRARALLQDYRIRLRVAALVMDVSHVVGLGSNL
jgi:hypothetical protein